MVGISKLLHSLLPNDRPPSSPRDYRSIQTIYFPPHYQDSPDARPKCKGFALLTLSEPSAASHLLTHFPYHPKRANKDSATAPADEAPHEEELEARKAGFRTLSKERWEALQTEYVEYHDALIRRLATSAPPDPTPESVALAGKATRARAMADHDQAWTSQPPSEPQPRTTIHSTQSPSPPRDGYGYPTGCVIFVRHVPPDTNKTALRARFSALLADRGARLRRLHQGSRHRTSLSPLPFVLNRHSLHALEIVLFALDDAGIRRVAPEAIRTTRRRGDRTRIVGRTTRRDVLGVRARQGARPRGATFTGTPDPAGRWRRLAGRRPRRIKRDSRAKAETTARSDLLDPLPRKSHTSCRM